LDLLHEEQLAKENRLMSDDLVNIRMWGIHFHLKRNFIPKMSRNGYHKAGGWPDGYFSVYDFFGLVR